MKLVLQTKRHFGDTNISRQGVQFVARFIESPNDTHEEYRAMHELVEIVRADCKESGWYFGFPANATHQEPIRHHHESLKAVVPLSKREAAIKARAISAENLARALKKENDAMRLAMVRAGVSVRVEVGQERSE